MASHDPMRPPLLSVALLSGAALAYEVLLLRLFSIIQWHHLAAMVISLALLGYGASGTLLSLGRQWLLARHARAYTGAAALFPVTALGCFSLAQRLPITPDALLWEGAQALRLLQVYLLLALPFACAGTAIGLALIRWAGRAGRVYAADLLGAGSGSLAVLLVLLWLPPDQTLLAVVALGLLAATAAALQLRLARWSLLTLSAAAVLPLLPEAWVSLQPSEYKDQVQTLRVKGAELVAESSGPLGQLALVDNATVPLRFAPGLSLRSRAPIPRQRALFVDGDLAGAVSALDGGRASLVYTAESTAALPYHLRPLRRVLVLHAGAGQHLLRAHYHGAVHIDAVELDPRLPLLLARPVRDFDGDPYALPGVRLLSGAPRAVVQRLDGDYDLIQIELANAPGAPAGMRDLKPTYDHTVEALRSYLALLHGEGYLAITGWTQLPARDMLKMLATVAAALRDADPHSRPSQQVAMIRDWQTATLVVKASALSDGEIAALRQFCERLGFDLAYHPGMPQSDANRLHRLPQPIYFQAAQALLGDDPEAFARRYRYGLQPARDDRPYFYDFFRWGLLAEAWSNRHRGGLALMSAGMPVLLTTLGQALLAATLLILLPLRWLAGPDPAFGEEKHRLPVLAYFLLLGLGFLFMEIAYIHRFVLVLHHPLYAAAAVLAGFLVFAGIGSALAQALEGRLRRSTLLGAAITLVAAYGSVMGHWLPPLLQAQPLGSTPAYYAAVLLALAPLALAMGVPFPLGLLHLQRNAPRLLPWAWAINGCASVVAAVLATAIAIQWGFALLVGLAASCYACAAAIYFWMRRAATRRPADAVQPGQARRGGAGPR